MIQQAVIFTFTFQYSLMKNNSKATFESFILEYIYTSSFRSHWNQAKFSTVHKFESFFFAKYNKFIVISIFSPDTNKSLILF